MNNKEVKDIYNKIVRDTPKGDYERSIWFKNDIHKARYEMTMTSIKRYVGPINFSHCLELGSGQGTWTQQLIELRPNAEFDLVDISKEMLDLSRERFANRSNIRYFECDFLDFRPDREYDLFFSIRTIEYVSDKDLMSKKILDSLIRGGTGFIVTKTPKYLRNKLLRRKVSELHRGQIQPQSLIKFLKKYGADNIKAYPATMSCPFLGSPCVNKLLHTIFYKHRLNFVSKFFSESYCVKFSKI